MARINQASGRTTTSIEATTGNHADRLASLAQLGKHIPSGLSRGAQRKEAARIERDLGLVWRAAWGNTTQGHYAAK
jgi:hypothetical protein